MGYLCPVCEEPFGDATGCANHLAVTAILHGGPHERWLADAVDDREGVDERATADETADWESVPRAELADLVADRAEETTDHDHPGDHTHPVDGDHIHPVDGGQSVSDGHPVDGGRRESTQGQPAITESSAETTQLDTDARAILSEARDLTRQMQARGPDDADRTESDSADERKES